MLAIFGGEPVNKKQFEWNSLIGEEEKRAALEVLESKVLSDFYGSAGERFLGGKNVRAFESEWATSFGSKFAVSMNSATSCLYAAIGALGLGEGDEVIVPPLTMSASVVCVLGYQAIPVFADLESDYFCLDPKSVEEKITTRTKAIVAVNLFGQPANFSALRLIAEKHRLTIIEDCAQAPGAQYSGRAAGTLGKIGIFSLNCHKAIQCGEGGIAVTDDEELALRLQLIRNHAESVVEGMGYTNLINMLGQNYRLTEIQAAIARTQLKKLQAVNTYKQEMAECLNKALSPFPFLQIPKVRPEATHVYYLYVLKYDQRILGISRDTFIRALNAEGYQASYGYVKPLYLLPLFQKKILYTNGAPFNGNKENQETEYPKGLCPVSERLHFEEIFYPNLIRYKITREDVMTFARAVEKVASSAHELRNKGEDVSRNI